MKAWLSRTQLRQRPMLAVYAVLLILIAVVIGAASLRWLSSGSDDRLAVIGNFLSLGTLLLALVAGIVALAAYSAATGSPNLYPEITFRFSYPNHPTFAVALMSDENSHLRQVADYRQVEGKVAIINSSRYAARNPGMRIELDGLGGISSPPGWAVVAWENQVGPLALQWDGGADYIIHGRWSRALPMLDVHGMYEYKDDPAFIVDIAADGFGPKRFRIPVRILDEEDYAKYSDERNKDFQSKLKP